MKKTLALLAFALCCPHLQAQNVEGQIIAAQYGEFKVPSQSTGGFQFPTATCQVSGGGKNFDAFAAGRAVKIVDGNPSLTEISTPSSAYLNPCVLNMTTTYNHVPPFYLTSGTGGLQEAITANQQGIAGPNSVILNAEWYSLIQPRSAATVIASVQGNVNMPLVDVTTSPYTWYQWNGSAYAAIIIGSGGFPVTIGSTSIAAQSTNTALQGLKIINGTSYSVAYSGSTVDQRVNACLSDAMSLANGNTTGICDASGETGILTAVSQINVGNSSGAQVTLKVPSQGQWRGAMTDGTSCTVNQYGNTSIMGVGPESGIGTQFVFGATASSNLACIFKLTPLGSQLNYIHDSNFAIVNVNGGPYVGHVTTGGIGANFVGPMYDSSTVDHVVIFDALDATAAQVSGFCCGAVFRNMSINGNYGSGVTPLVITNTSAFNMETLSVVHPGATKPLIQVTDSSAHVSNVNIHGLYTEGSNTDTTTNWVHVDGYGSVNLSAITAKAEASGVSAPFMTSTNTTNTGTTISGFNAVNGAGDWFYPVTVINNSYTGQVVLSDNTGSKGNLGYYSSGAASVTALNVGGTGGGIVKPAAFSVAGTPLPTCNSSSVNSEAVVSDATSPASMSAYTGGGTITAPVVCSYNGTSYTWLTVGGSTGSASQKVIYASKIAGVTTGVAVVPGSSATGTTDSASAINTAIAGGNVDLEVDSGFALSTSLVLSSNTTIHCIAPQYGFIMQAAANTPVWVNAHQNAPTTSSGTGGYLVSNITDQNIQWIGCQTNSNSLEAVTGNGLTGGVAHTTNPGTGLMVPAIQVAGVNGLRIDNNEIYDGGVYAVAASNVENVHVDGNYTHNPTPTVNNKFTDGIHFVGPATLLWVNNNRISAGDDSIAFNADDVNRTGSGSGNQAASSLPGFKWGPITDAVADGNTFDAGDYGIRVNSATELADNIQFTHTTGTLCGNTGEFATISALGNGNIGKVKVDGWQVQTDGSCNTFTQPYNFVVQSNYQAIQIDGVQITNPGVTWPVVTLLSGTGGIFSMHDWDLTTTSTTFSNVVVTTGGTLGQILTSGINWKDTVGTGHFFSGATVPATLTCSNYVGPNRLLNYAPANLLGDCFSGLTYLSTIVTAGNQSTVTFSSIPQNYRNLRLVAQFQLSSGGSGNLQANFNADSGTAHYGWQLLFGAGSTASALASISSTADIIGPGLGGDSCDIFGYASAALGVNTACTFGQFIIGSNANAGTASGFWNQTTPVTSIVLSDFASGHFVNGSTFTLYGYQ